MKILELKTVKVLRVIFNELRVQLVKSRINVEHNR